MIPGALGFLVMTAYWPDISGAAVAPKWAVMVGALVLVLMGPAIRFTTGHLTALLFAWWCTTSMLWAGYPLDGIDALGRMVLLAGAFCLGAQLQSIRPVMIGSGLGLSVSSALAILQWYGITSIVDAPGPAGLFLNKNFLAEAAALVIVYAVASRIWWLVLAMLPAVVLPQARGAWLAIAVCAVIMLWQRSRIATIIATALAIAFMGYAVLSVPLFSMTERMAIWQDTAANLSLFGYGIGGFVENFPLIAKQFAMVTSRPRQAHNEYLQVAFETGFVGLALMIPLLVTLLRGPATPVRLVLIAMLVEACFAFPFQMPATGFLGLLVAGHIAAGRISVFDAIAGGGVALLAWLFRGAGSERRLRAR